MTLPGCGVRLGVSAYTGQDEDAEPDDARHTSAGAHVEYVTQSWSVRSEYSHVRDRQETSTDAFYLEAARRLGDAWQIAARYDRFAARMNEVDTDAAPSLLEHREVTLGLNYWFHPDLVAKLALSDIEGHRFARPEDLADAVADGALPQRIRHLSLGVQFAF